MKLQKKLNYDNVIFFDLETSGLHHWEGHEIIQFAAYCPATGENIELKLFFDEEKADPEALKMNNYDSEVWDREAVEQKEGLKIINNFFIEHSFFEKTSPKSGKSYRVAVCGGYNVNAFDKDFMIETFKKHNIFMKCDYRMFDVYPLVMFSYPNLLNYKLTDINKFLGLPEFKAHDALGDVYMTANIAACTIYDTFKGDSNDDTIPEWVYDVLEDIGEI